MSRRVFAASLGLAVMLVSSHAFAGVIVQNLGGSIFGGTAAIQGQSFTIPSSGGPWDDITFNFFLISLQQPPRLLVMPFFLTRSTWERQLI